MVLIIFSMAEEKYVLISLEDERAKNIADALGNKTCKKILDLLAEKELSETEISKFLSIPLNTAEYNIKKLIKAGLIEEKKHFFSIKGKRIPFYKISNKHIIISPRKTSLNKLKSIFPVVFISAIFTAFILWYEKSKIFIQETIRAETLEKTVGAIESIGAEEKIVGVGVRGGGFSGFLSSLSIVEWFLIVLWMGLVIFVILSLRSERRLK